MSFKSLKDFVDFTRIVCNKWRSRNRDSWSEHKMFACWMNTVQQKIFVSEKFRQKRPSGSSSGIYFRQTDRSFCLRSFGSLAYRLSSHSWLFLIPHLSFWGKFSQEFNLVKKIALTKATKLNSWRKFSAIVHFAVSANVQKFCPQCLVREVLVSKPPYC